MMEFLDLDAKARSFMTAEQRREHDKAVEVGKVNSGVSSDELEAPEMRRILSSIARHAIDMRVRVAAIAKLAEMKGLAKGQGEEELIGPNSMSYTIEDLLRDRGGEN